MQFSRGLLLADRPVTEVGPQHFRLEEIALSPPEDGDVLVAARYLAIEPLLRGRLMDRDSYAPSVQLGEVMAGRAISEVIESRSAEYVPGDYVEHWLGWREHAVVPAASLSKLRLGAWPVTANLGVLGSSGLSALLALTKLGRPKTGETVLITAAAGAVGALAVQIAKMFGCRVVAIAGGGRKCDYVRSIGADIAIDYKSADVASLIGEACPDGVDIFFDAVGGNIHDAAMANLAVHGRVIVFGTMSLYSNPEADDVGRRQLRAILVKRATLSGFLIRDHEADIPSARAQLEKWWEEGRLKAREDIRTGLDAAPEALADVIAGRANGKVLIKIE